MITPSQYQEAAKRLKNAWLDRRRVDPTLTQERIASLCGWKTQAAFSQYANGKTKLNWQALLRISRALRLDPEEIFPELAAQNIGPRVGALLLGRGRTDDDHNKELIKVRRRIAVATKVGGLDSSPAGNEVDLPVAFVGAELRRRGVSQDLDLFTATDPDMSPDFPIGDVIVVDAQDKNPPREPKTPQAFVVTLRDSAPLIRFCECTDSGIRLFDSEGASELVPVERVLGDLRVFGRVVFQFRDRS